MKNICFYIDNLGRGGAERVISTLANMFSKDGYRVYFVCNKNVNNEYELNPDIVRSTIINELGDVKCKVVKKIKTVCFLRKYFKDNKIDIGIAFMGGNNFILLLASFLSSVKTIVSVRNDPEYEYPTMMHKIIYSILFPTADKIIFQTSDEKRYFNKRIQSLGEIIYNPVADRFYCNNYTGERKDIVTVGRLVNQKNQKLLIDAFSEISDSYKDVNLIIYGEGELYEELNEYIYKLNLADRIFLKGVVKDIERHVGRAVVFVMCSQNEGLPNALMEAMALGVPVISTNCRGGGPAELIENEKNGILIPCDNKRELIVAMKKMLDSKEKRILLADNAKRTAMKFNEKTIYNKWKIIVNGL
jgi:glycosyltransferase involved in cell wall biosynthesis